MRQRIVSWWIAVLSRWCRAYPQTARRHRGSDVGVLVVGCVLVWHGVGWAQQRALSPGDFHVRWHIAQVSAEVPRIQGQLTIFTAASLTEAFKEMGDNIEQANPGTKVTFNFAGSPTLRTQLAQGARADVFASADEPNMQGAQKEGTIASEPRLFVRNQLVAIVPTANPAQVMRLQDLAKPGVKLVLTNKEVPVGNYSRQALAKMSQDAAFGSEFATRVLANLVSEETNVRQVVAKVQLGEAHAGIVYSSDVTPAVRGAVKVLAIPDPFNVIAHYPIAVVRDAPNAAGARAFIDYVLSPAGQAILTKHGFLAVEAPPRAN
jgi:molybdate transport system substrate-binding protein